MTKQAIKEKSEQKLLEIILEMWIKGESKLSRTVEVSHNPDKKILKLDSRGAFGIVLFRCFHVPTR